MKRNSNIYAKKPKEDIFILIKTEKKLNCRKVASKAYRRHRLNNNHGFFCINPSNQDYQCAKTITFVFNNK
jgi:hypothetical protein